MTAAALTPFGLVADLVPSAFRAEQLVRELGAHLLGQGARVLFPCGTLARQELPAGLEACGATVHPLVVYRTLPEAPEASARRALEAGVDAVLFASPSAVDAFVAAGLPLSGTTAALGETTANALRRHGLAVGGVADEHSDDGLIAALEHAFAEREAAA
jgi:uroporphyrinogen-III synthase